MIDIAKNILTHSNIYTISLLIIVALLLLCLLSAEFKRYFKFPLQISLLIWLIFIGYQIYTGNSLYYIMTAPSQSEIEAAKYEKHMIDGREVYYNKDTGEVVKKPKK
jgi:hypothetical protein